jgi:acyl carrier protein
VPDVGSRIAGFIEDEILYRRGGVKLAADTPLEAGLVDSLGMTRIVSFLEEEFDVTIENRDMVPANFRTVADIERLVRSKLRASRG